jgi:hypothetical protein
MILIHGIPHPYPADFNSDAAAPRRLIACEGVVSTIACMRLRGRQPWWEEVSSCDAPFLCLVRSAGPLGRMNNTAHNKPDPAIDLPDLSGGN